MSNKLSLEQKETIFYNLLNSKRNINVKSQNFEIEFFHYSMLFLFDRNKYRHLESNNLSGVNDYHLAYNFMMDYVPEFQRDNDKWDNHKKVSFVSNLFKEQVSSSIIIAHIKELDCRWLLDGVQRVTALHDFFVNDELEFDLGNNQFITSGEIRSCQSLSTFFHSQVNVSIITFDTELEALDYYIDMNDGNTHSDQDLKRAIAYRDKLLNK